MTDAEKNRLAAFDAMSGADQLRRVVRVIGGWRESSMDPYTDSQIIDLVRMCIASDWEFGLEYWSARQRKEALRGVPPRWDHEERPMYS